ncbi:recombinase family protein [Streptomyces microflavus]|uniref:recombinase family protein n=1 Tax=Streptomyces microflavus TaxID=1919 RepID=UPI002E14286A|nr:recombinase family protein [Streptomyces microflavus]
MNVTIYVRLSQDRHGDSLGVERQEAECRAFAEARGWTVREALSDNDISATKGKVRPGFEALLMSKPEAVLVWHTDRLIRVTRDLERVIDLGVNVHAIHAGHLDLSTPAGRAVARTVTAWATYEGEQKAIRQIASNVQAARAGKPYTAGIRPFGYGDDHMAVIPKEAAAIVEGAQMILAGESLSAVARAWNEAGLVSPRSKAQSTKAEGWTLRGVKNLLTSPRYIGQRTYKGDVVGEAEWPAILDEATHYACVAILNSPERFSGGRRTGRVPGTLLASIALCGVCGETVNGRSYRGAPVYGCKATHTRTPRELVDKRVGNSVIARLAFPDFLPSILAANAEKDGDSAGLHVEAKNLRERLDGLALAYAEGAISLSQMTAGTEAIRAKLDAVEGKLTNVTGLPPIDPVAGIAGLIEGWPNTPLPTRRAWVDFTTTVTLLPQNGKHASSMTVNDHVRVEWRQIQPEE